MNETFRWSFDPTRILKKKTLSFHFLCICDHTKQYRNSATMQRKIETQRGLPLTVYLRKKTVLVNRRKKELDMRPTTNLPPRAKIDISKNMALLPSASHTILSPCLLFSIRFLSHPSHLIWYNSNYWAPKNENEGPCKESYAKQSLRLMGQSQF